MDNLNGKTFIQRTNTKVSANHDFCVELANIFAQPTRTIKPPEENSKRKRRQSFPTPRLLILLRSAGQSYEEEKEEDEKVALL